MFGKILVPIDFSDCSLNALKFATAFAKKANSKLFLVNGYHIPVPIAEGMMVIDTEVTENYQKLTLEKFEKLIETVPNLEEVIGEYKVEISFVQDAILTAADQFRVDLIIMGTKGASGVLENVLGSNTLGIIKKASCSVLSVPENVQDIDIKKLLFAFDYEFIESQSSIAPAIDMARSFRAEIHILNVSEKGESLDTEKIEGAQILQQYLKNVPHFYHRCESPTVAEGINDYIQAHEIDLIMVMPRRHSIFEKLFHKSVTRQLAHHSNLPLLTFHES